MKRKHVSIKRNKFVEFSFLSKNDKHCAFVKCMASVRLRTYKFYGKVQRSSEKPAVTFNFACSKNVKFYTQQKLEVSRQ